MKEITLFIHIGRRFFQIVFVGSEAK